MSFFPLAWLTTAYGVYYGINAAQLSNFKSTLCNIQFEVGLMEQIIICIGRKEMLQQSRDTIDTIKCQYDILFIKKIALFKNNQ